MRPEALDSSPKRPNKDVEGVFSPTRSNGIDIPERTSTFASLWIRCLRVNRVPGEETLESVVEIIEGVRSKDAGAMPFDALLSAAERSAWECIIEVNGPVVMGFGLEKDDEDEVEDEAVEAGLNCDKMLRDGIRWGCVDGDEWGGGDVDCCCCC